MKAHILAIMISAVAYFANSQDNIFFIGNKAYPCTDNIFILGDCTQYMNMGDEWVNTLDLFFVKGARNKVVFKTKIGLIHHISRALSGDIIFYLDNNTSIRLIDRNITDRVDGYEYNVYYLTQHEINTLKKTNIRVIRYNNKTIENKDLICYRTNSLKRPTSKGERFEQKRVDFPQIISELFK